MQLSGATVWWDEWQLRILVLASLGIRWFLLLVAPTRQFTIPGWFRTCIGIAFSSSDAVAIYALATLFNRHGGNAISSSHALSNGSVLQVLWAPVLLIHLGGQEGMTAYRLEDNDLWTRQAVTVVSQVMIALYSLYKSWPSYGDMRLLASTILLFIIGILSYSQKPWALRRASINKLQAVASARLTQAVRGGEKVTSGWDFCFTELGKKKQTTLLTETDLVRMILYDMSLLAADSDMKREQRRRHQRKSLLGEDEGTVEVKPKREVEEAPRAGRKRPGKESVGGAASSRPHSGELGGRSSAPPRSSSARISSPSSKATSVGRGGSGAAFGSGGNSAGGRSSSSMRTSPWIWWLQSGHHSLLLLLVAASRRAGTGHEHRGSPHWVEKNLLGLLLHRKDGPDLDPSRNHSTHLSASDP